MDFQHCSSLEFSLETVSKFFDQATALAVQIHQLIDEMEILNTAVKETRKILECDRVIIYQFLPQGDGVIITESVGEQWISILGQLVYDPCFGEKGIEPYRQGKISIIEDIYTKPVESCYLELLERFQVRANLVVPILVGKQPEAQLWGLLIAQQCAQPRQWHFLEIKLLQNLAAQVGIALRKVEQNFIKQENIKNRKQEELLWKEALLRSLTDSSLLGFYVVDNRTDNILYFNHQFCEIWGIEHLEKQMHSGELKNNDIIPHCIPLLADLPAFIESCKPLQSEENRTIILDEIKFSDGRTIHRFSSQIRDVKDRYFGRVYIFDDVIKSKQSQKALNTSETRWPYVLAGYGDGIWDGNRETLAKEKEIDELKSRIITIISHEYLTPLTIIYSSVELLQKFHKKLTEEKLVNYLNKIELAAKRLTNLLKYAVQIEELEGQRENKLNLQPLNLVQLCAEIVEEAKISLKEQQKINFVTQEDCNLIQLDENVLRIILNNLLANAINYSSENTVINFTVICNNQQVQFRIKDEGIGIPEEEQEKIFETFYRAKNVNNISGTGLGLSLVKKSVELYSGEIDFISEVGVGTEFVVTIPINNSNSEQ